MFFLNKKSILIIFLLVIILFSCYSQDVLAANLSQLQLKTPTFNTKIAIVSSLIIMLLILFIWEPLPIGIIDI